MARGIEEQSDLGVQVHQFLLLQVIFILELSNLEIPHCDLLQAFAPLAKKLKILCCETGDDFNKVASGLYPMYFSICHRSGQCHVKVLIGVVRKLCFKKTFDFD